MQVILETYQVRCIRAGRRGGGERRASIPHGQVLAGESLDTANQAPLPLPSKTPPAYTHAATMSAPLRPTLLPQCTACTRRLTRFGLQEWRPSQQQQVRGKKKLANAPLNVTVRLLKDTPSFGRKGMSMAQIHNSQPPISLSGSKRAHKTNEQNPQAPSSPSQSGKCETTSSRAE